MTLLGNDENISSFRRIFLFFEYLKTFPIFNDNDFKETMAVFSVADRLLSTLEALKVKCWPRWFPDEISLWRNDSTFVCGPQVTVTIAYFVSSCKGEVK